MILTKSRRLEGGRWALIPSRYSEKFRDFARRYPGMAWDKTIKGWVGYSDSVLPLTQKLLEEGISKVVGDVPPQPSVLPSSFHEVGDPLRDYQKIAISFLLDKSSEGSILADGTGLGKTKSTLYAIRELGMPWVVVCPAVVKNVWKREAEKIGLSVTIINGTKPPEDTKISKNDGIIIINYDIVYAWVDVLKGAKGIVFDEGHALANSKSRRSQSCKELSHSCKHRIILTATPMTNRVKQLWNIVDTISPNRFGSFFSYALRYTNAFKEIIKVQSGEEKEIWNMDGSSNEEELKERLSQFMLKRNKVDVHLELPPKTRQIIEIDVPLNNIQNDWNIDNNQSVRLALNISAKAKITYAVELAINHFEESNSVVLFAHRRAVVEELKELFREKGHEIYTATGEDSGSKRDEILQKAKASAPSILAVTTHSMGEGIDLSFSNIGIIVELDYVPAKIIQLEGRQDRQGQSKNVLLQYLIGVGTIDELIRDAVLNKLETIEKIVGSTGDTLKNDLNGSKNEEDALNQLRDTLIKMGEEYV